MTTPPKSPENTPQPNTTPDSDVPAIALLGLARRLRELDTAVEAARQDLAETAQEITDLRVVDPIPPRLTLELRRRVKRLDNLEMVRAELATRASKIERDTVPVRVVSFS